jgi:predicted transport protein
MNMIEPTYGVIKMISGEEIIAEIIDEDDLHLTLLNPIQIHRRIARDGSSQLAASYWFHFSEDDHFKIKKDKIVALSSKIEDNALQQYIHFVTTRTEVIGPSDQQQEEYYSILEKKFEEILRQQDFQELVLDANTTIH